MPSKTVPEQCASGCSSMTKGGDYLPDHDSKTCQPLLKILEV